MGKGMLPLMAAIAALVLAVILPLASLRTENVAQRPPVLAMPGSGTDEGLFPAKWTAPYPGLAVVVGVLIPLGLISLATYILVRRPCLEADG
ncbi:MAG: hypothetical protein MK101_11160 [Phycisphaerales bacterium]|nr:hypothetical protein [Phycisphaerales bacterium]